jgi:disulfide bond formation protein DsbB
MWHQNSAGILGMCEGGDHFGYSITISDFDDDGYDDLAVGVRSEDIGTHSGAGAVNVIYGSSSGLSSTGNQMWHQNSPGVLGVCEAGDLFGDALAHGDFDNDGYMDLAIGAFGEDVGTRANAGAVHILHGSSSGLTSTGNQMWNQNSPSVLGLCENFDNFGEALTTGDFDGDGYDDLAIGVPSENLGSKSNPGVVNVLYGSVIGLSSTGNQMWHQNSPGVLGISESFDIFGSALATVDLNGDTHDDLVIGAPGEGIGVNLDTGAINILYGAPLGLSSMGNQLWHQNSPGILGLCEEDDNFGDALA